MSEVSTVQRNEPPAAVTYMRRASLDDSLALASNLIDAARLANARGADHALGVHMKQLRLTVISALETAKELLGAANEH